MEVTINSQVEIPVKKAARSRIAEVDFNNLVFGAEISDHMVVADFYDEQWRDAQIVPFQNLSVSPVSLGLHYGQVVFEGMKAFRLQNGSISLFRPQKHFSRFNISLQRMCMPAIPEDLFFSALTELLKLDEEWVPRQKNSSLYIRPFVFASEAKLGVKVSKEYKFLIVSSPVGEYFQKPLRVKVETQYSRAAEGGTGFAKCAGNYGGAFFPTQIARQQGYDQVLWTDSKEHKYFDEAGTMNVVFLMNGKLVTPPLSTTILDGITRDSILQLAKDFNVPIEVRRISIEEVENAIIDGRLVEAFGTGTAAVIAPIKTIGFPGADRELPESKKDSVTAKLQQHLLAIRTGKAPDKHHWNYIIE